MCRWRQTEPAPTMLGPELDPAASWPGSAWLRPLPVVPRPHASSCPWPGSNPALLGWKGGKCGSQGSAGGEDAPGRMSAGVQGFFTAPWGPRHGWGPRSRAVGSGASPAPDLMPELLLRETWLDPGPIQPGFNFCFIFLSIPAGSRATSSHFSLPLS